MLIVLARGSPASLQPELLTVALQSHLDLYFSCPQRVLQDAWKPFAMPFRGISQLFMACSETSAPLSWLWVEGRKQGPYWRLQVPVPSGISRQDNAVSGDTTSCC